jgi:hypothetical protein
MTTSTSSEIIEAIAKTDDTNLKTVLLLMLRMTEEIGDKIEAIYTDKDLLKESVLNGHAKVHHDDHEWIKQQRVIEADRLYYIDRAKAAITWVEDKAGKERDLDLAIKANSRRVFSDLIGKVIWLVAGMLVYAAVSGIPKLI